MIESHVNEPEEDPNNLLYFDEENADILDRPDLFYGHPEDIVNDSIDDDYLDPPWEGGMGPGYDVDFNSVEDPYDRPTTGYGRSDPPMYYGEQPTQGYEDYDGDDMGYARKSTDVMHGARPASRHGYGRY